METYRVVWVNLMSLSGKPRSSTVKVRPGETVTRATARQFGLMSASQVTILESRKV